MRRMLVVGGALAAGCLGSAPRERTTVAGEAPQELRPTTAGETWYRAVSICGQGPYEIEVPVASARWGEEVELRLSTPRRVRLHAVIVADDAEVAKDAATFGSGGRADGAAENTRCVADARERLAAGRARPPTGPGTVVETGVRVRTPGPPPPGEPPPGEVSVTGRLEIDRGAPPTSIEIMRHGWRYHELAMAPPRFGRIRIRLWSIEPNDLEGVWFGIRRIEWRPPGTDAEYEAYLVRREAQREAERRRQEEELRRRIAEDEERRRRQPPPPPPAATVHIDARAELERYRREEEERRRRAEQIAREREEARLRREAEAAAEAERVRRRQAFCASHPEDRGCWGAGGLRVHQKFEELQRERDGYCAAQPQDARCWAPDEHARRRQLSRQRIQIATAPPKQPDGPPPAPLAETKPPKLSANAEWRDGYWHWTGKDWVWLAGMWRVPEADIEAERTTTAPEAPPPLRTEAIPPPPMAAAIWVDGFWQWSGTAWVWVAGSYQARPDAGSAWRPAEWRVRGRVHVLIPGTWVRGGRRGR